MSGDGLSRRSFLGASGAGVALGLMPRALAHATPVDAGERSTVDVVVVGAGLSGLVAAHRLRHAGLSVLVVEARSDVAPVASFGQLRHEVIGLADTHTGVLALARELRVPVGRVRSAGRAVERAGGATYEVPEGSYSADSRVDAEVQAAIRRLDWLARETDADQPWRAANAAVRDARTLQQWLDAKVHSLPARHRLTTLFGAVWGGHPSESSLLHALAVGAGSGGVSELIAAATAPALTIDGGEEVLLSRLASPLGSALRTGSMVRSIGQDADRALVTTDAGEVEARRGVIVAVPAAATAAIRFDPGLPRDRELLAQRLPRASTATVACTYPTAFWEGRGLSGRAVADEAAVGVAFPVASRWGPTLVARLSGRSSTEWEALPARGRREAVLDALRRWFGDPAGRPTSYDELLPGSGEWPARGSASLAPPGVLSSLGPALRSPFGLVAWAGNETARTWAGFPEGSVESGERAASELVRGLGVLPGSPAPRTAGIGSVEGEG